MKVKNEYGKIEKSHCIDKRKKQFDGYYEECPNLPFSCDVYKCRLNEEIPFKCRRGMKETAIKVKRLNGEYNFEAIMKACEVLDNPKKTAEDAFNACKSHLDSSGQAGWVLYEIYNLSANGEKFKRFVNEKYGADPDIEGMVSSTCLPVRYHAKQDPFEKKRPEDPLEALEMDVEDMLKSGKIKPFEEDVF